MISVHLILSLNATPSCGHQECDAGECSEVGHLHQQGWADKGGCSDHDVTSLCSASGSAAPLQPPDGGLLSCPTAYILQPMYCLYTSANILMISHLNNLAIKCFHSATLQPPLPILSVQHLVHLLQAGCILEDNASVKLVPNSWSSSSLHSKPNVRSRNHCRDNTTLQHKSLESYVL